MLIVMPLKFIILWSLLGDFCMPTNPYADDDDDVEWIIRLDFVCTKKKSGRERGKKEN